MSFCEVALHETEKDTKLRKAPLDTCYEVMRHIGQEIRNYCDILCPGADTVYLIKRNPPNHRNKTKNGRRKNVCMTVKKVKCVI
uniref:rRNA_proc-arch domain-containing protein n=1 Tax=Heterorhabditis bacteriophora TaxID=37862 RepID=A0A1I7XLC4_HETBA